MALLSPETVARDILSLYEDNFSTSLATVADTWDATEEIDLEDFATRKISAAPEILEKTWILPALVIGIGTAVDQGAEEGTQQYHNLYALDVQIFYYLSHPDSEILGKKIMRYMEATFEFLNRYPAFGRAGDFERIIPGTLQLAPSTTGRRSNVLVKGLLVRASLGMLQYGF